MTLSKKSQIPEPSNGLQRHNIQGIPCADNAIDVLYYGHKLHIIFLQSDITILTDEPIVKADIIKEVQGFRKLIVLEYKK